MRLLTTFFLACFSLAALGESTTDQILPEKWWPSEWGEQDELGAMNRLGSHKVLEAAALISQGKVLDL